MLNALLPLIGSVFDKVLPDPQAAADAKLRAMEMAQKGELAALDADVRLALGQMEVNKAEATTDIFRGGWRPAVGWVCAAALAYQYIARPLLIGFGLVPDTAPALDGALWELLAGMLGLGGLRTFERVRGVTK